MANRGRLTVSVTVSPSERTTLALGAQIVLACATGHSNSEIATELRITRQTVGWWRRRFVQKRLDGLVDEPRPGAPRGISDAQVEQVIIDTLATRRDNSSYLTPI